MEKREFKDKVFSELAVIAEAMGSARRLEIVDLLSQGEKSVEKIARQAGMSVANASKHLQVLRVAGLVEVKKQGNFNFYRLASDQVLCLWQLLRLLGTDGSGKIDKLVQAFRTSQHRLESVSIEDLLGKMRNGEVVLLDVRPEDEFSSGHIAGALSIPVEHLATRLKELPRYKEIVAYCRGPFCVFADEAVSFLLENGFSARRLEEGFPDWKLKGLPVE